jgi:maltooligosyltrehalose trehalohydrolase
VLAWHRALLELRRRLPALAALEPGRTTTHVDEDARTLVVHRRGPHDDDVIVVLAFARRDAEVPVRVDLDGRQWRTRLDSHADAEPALVLERDAAVELLRPPRSVLVLQRAS